MDQQAGGRHHDRLIPNGICLSEVDTRRGAHRPEVSGPSALSSPGVGSHAGGVSQSVEPPQGGLIVVGVDGSAASKAALSWALRQAELSGSSLEVVAAWGLPVYVGDADLWPIDVDLESLVTRQLQLVLEEVVPVDSTVPLQALVCQAPPAVALIEAAEGAELLVVGSRGHSELAEMLLGSVSLHCVARAPCPVVVVHSADRYDPETRTFGPRSGAGRRPR